MESHFHFVLEGHQEDFTHSFTHSFRPPLFCDFFRANVNGIFFSLKCDTCSWGLHCKQQTAASSLANSPTVSLNAQTVCVSADRKRPLVRESAV